MKKMIKLISVLAIAGVSISGLLFAQSDYASRTSWTAAKAPQSTKANIHQRQGVIVGHYIYGMDGALATNVQKVIKEGEGIVTLPDNAIITSNSLACIDITTASDPTTTTGAVFFGSSLVYTGSLGSAGVQQIQLPLTKMTTNSTLRVVVSANIPTNALSLSVYMPYILGD